MHVYRQQQQQQQQKYYMKYSGVTEIILEWSNMFSKINTK